MRRLHDRSNLNRLARVWKGVCTRAHNLSWQTVVTQTMRNEMLKQILWLHIWIGGRLKRARKILYCMASVDLTWAWHITCLNAVCAWRTINNITEKSRSYRRCPHWEPAIVQNRKRSNLDTTFSDDVRLLIELLRGAITASVNLLKCGQCVQSAVCMATRYSWYLN